VPKAESGAGMGIIKESKASTAAEHASRAAREGRTVFLYRFNVPATSSGWSGPISGAAEVIEAVERNGWQLSDFAYDRAQSDHGAVLLMFRRGPRRPAAPGPQSQAEIDPDWEMPPSQNEHQEQMPQRYYEPQPGGDYPPSAPRYDQQQAAPRVPAPWPQGPPGRPSGRHHDPRRQGY
jgi:hypothetical protein